MTDPPTVLPTPPVGFTFAAPPLLIASRSAHPAVASQASIVLPIGSDDISTVAGWQVEAWNYYGSPISEQNRAIGEVRYVIGWHAQQCSRVDWSVSIDNRLLDPEEAQPIIEAVASESITTQLATNLLVAGQLDYTAWPATDDLVAQMTELGAVFAGTGDTRWLVVSVVDPNRRQLLENAQLKVPGIWPHPGQPARPDPPVRGVLDVLEEITQLQHLAHAQNNSRIAQMSLLLVATELDMALSAGGSAGSFSLDLQNAINAPIRDPRQTGAAPIILTGPADIIERGGAAKAVQVGQPYDPRLDQRMEAAVRRLAWGLPIPPEALIGMTSTNRATAFQIEESSYRGHIEPVASMVGVIYGNAATMLFDQGRIEFFPDPSDLLARRHSVADVKDAWDRGLVKASWVRKTLGIPEDAAAEEEDIVLLISTRGTRRQTDRQVDPSDSVADEAVRSAATIDQEVSLLAAIDDDLRSSLRGACEMAARRARERVGAKARSALRNDTTLSLIDGIPNPEVATTLSLQTISDLMDLESVVVDSLEPLASWWEGTLTDARRSVESIVGEVRTDWVQAASRSTVFLLEQLARFIIEGLDADLLTVPTDIVRGAVAIAGGGDAPA